MGREFINLFAGLFRKQGFEVIIWEMLEVLEFKSHYIEGMLQYDIKNKPFKIRLKFKTRKNYELLDVPFGSGAIIVDFRKATDLLEFLPRRLMWRKRK